MIQKLNLEDENDFYSLEELDHLENQTMAYIARKFGNLRFRKDVKYKFRDLQGSFIKVDLQGQGMGSRVVTSPNGGQKKNSLLHMQ